MTPINLTWQGPYTFLQFINDESTKEKYAKPGLYLWKLRHDKEPGVFYVGKAKGKPSLSQRQADHYMKYIGGFYRIPAFIIGNQEDWSFNLAKENVCDVISNEEKYIGVVEKGFELTRLIEIYLAPYGDIEKINDIERNLIYYLQPSGTEMGKHSKPGKILTIINNNAKWKNEYIVKNLKMPGNMIIY